MLSAEEAVELSAYKYSQAAEAVIDIYSRYRITQIEEARLKLQQDAYEANQAAYERAVGRRSRAGFIVEIRLLSRPRTWLSIDGQPGYRIKLKALPTSHWKEAWELEPLPDT